MRKIALFGGSFDPVQNGHVEFIRLLAARFDKTIVVPCRISPFKTEADIASAPDRKAMLANRNFTSILPVSLSSRT